MPLHRQLLSQAKRLANLDPKRPQQANLRRALSTAYYAIFHFFIYHAWRSMLGTLNANRPFRDVLSRAFQHAEMFKACKSFAGGTLPDSVTPDMNPSFSVPVAIRTAAQTFCDAQEKRHSADYNLSASFRRSDVLATIKGIEDAMASFNAIRAQPESRFFLACLVTWRTISARN